MSDTDTFVLREVRKHYGDREVLRGASLRLQSGKLVLVTVQTVQVKQHCFASRRALNDRIVPESRWME